jgi:hypothetical protein
MLSLLFSVILFITMLIQDRIRKSYEDDDIDKDEHEDDKIEDNENEEDEYEEDEIK